MVLNALINVVVLRFGVSDFSEFAKISSKKRRNERIPWRLSFTAILGGSFPFVESPTHIYRVHGPGSRKKSTVIGTHINMILLFVVVCKRARLRISPDVCTVMWNDGRQANRCGRPTDN